MPSVDLGDALRRARGMKGKSLAAVAKPADISPTYLQKLERGDVRAPSPHVLHRIAKELDLPYLELMRLAGYATSEGEVETGDAAGSGALTYALRSEELTEDEAAAIAEYLTFIRNRRGRAVHSTGSDA